MTHARSGAPKSSLDTSGPKWDDNETCAAAGFGKDRRVDPLLNQVAVGMLGVRARRAPASVEPLHAARFPDCFTQPRGRQSSVDDGSPDYLALIRLVGATELLLTLAEQVNGEIADEAILAELYELRDRATDALRHVSER